MSTSLALQFMEVVTQARDDAGAPQSFDTTALSSLQDYAAEPGRFSAVLPVSPDVQNRYGTLHGGCIGRWAGVGRAWRRQRWQSACRAAWERPVQQQPARRAAHRYPPAPACALPAVCVLFPAATIVDVVGTAALVTVSDKSGVSLK